VRRLALVPVFLAALCACGSPNIGGGGAFIAASGDAVGASDAVTPTGADGKVATDGTLTDGGNATPDAKDGGETTIDATGDDTAAQDVVVLTDTGKDTTCTPQCAAIECGDDGCGGSCGKCPGAAPQCIEGICKKQTTCTANCSGKTCGSDGCGGSCGKCGANASCEAGQCKTKGNPIAKGASCYGKSADCATGSKCMITAQLDDWVCMATLSAGQACGPGLGDCGAGATCNWTDVGKTALKCFAAVGQGQPCVLPGFGSCSDGLQCVYTDSSGKTKCAPIVGTGQACSILQKGLCAPGQSCVPETATSTTKVCTVDVPAGSDCGPGKPGCEAGATCIWTDTTKKKAMCYADAAIGEPCGGWGMPQDCAGWAICTPESGDPDAAATCEKAGLIGQICGYGIGFCTPHLGCAYTDETKTKAVCKKLVGADKVCGAETVCSSGYTCALQNQGDTTGLCKDSCELKKTYGDGKCDSCAKVDPDCVKP
jgi:hypothetical protein